MVERKIVLLASIINGRKKVVRNLEKYNKLKENKQIDIDYYEELESTFNDFKINLFNYANSFIQKDSKKYFDDYQNIENYFNQKKYIEELGIEYTLKDLFRSFRNRQEHPDKINQQEEYIAFQKNITYEMLQKLFKICDKTLDLELNKLNEEDAVKIFFGNTEICLSLEKRLERMNLINEQAKKQNLAIYNINKEVINKISNIDFTKINLSKLCELDKCLQEYLDNDIIKNEIKNSFGVDVYENIIHLYDNDDLNINSIKGTINDFFISIHDNHNSN